MTEYGYGPPRRERPAGKHRGAVVYDANVLVGKTLRETLYRVAQEGLARAVITSRILREAYLVLSNAPRPDSLNVFVQQAYDERTELGPGFSRLIDEADAVRDMYFTNWEAWVSCAKSFNERDRHVVAAAVGSGAYTIVSNDKGDFPADLLEPLELRRVSADAFLLECLHAAPHQMTYIGMRHRTTRRRGEQTLLDKLAVDCPSFVVAFSPYLLGEV